MPLPSQQRKRVGGGGGAGMTGGMTTTGWRCAVRTTFASRTHTQTSGTLAATNGAAAAAGAGAPHTLRLTSKQQCCCRRTPGGASHTPCAASHTRKSRARPCLASRLSGLGRRLSPQPLQPWRLQANGQEHTCIITTRGAPLGHTGCTATSHARLSSPFRKHTTHRQVLHECHTPASGRRS
jgi:hypothetical protein